MATKRTLILQSKDTDGELIQRTITNANPSATDENLDTFLRAYNGLTDNAYVDGLVVDTKSLKETLAD